VLLGLGLELPGLQRLARTNLQRRILDLVTHTRTITSSPSSSPWPPLVLCESTHPLPLHCAESHLFPLIRTWMQTPTLTLGQLIQMIYSVVPLLSPQNPSESIIHQANPPLPQFLSRMTRAFSSPLPPVQRSPQEPLIQERSAPSRHPQLSRPSLLPSSPIIKHRPGPHENPQLHLVPQGSSGNRPRYPSQPLTLSAA
jgi:hypothetical protein